jgi:hypothetical protein
LNELKGKYPSKDVSRGERLVPDRNPALFPVPKEVATKACVALPLSLAAKPSLLPLDLSISLWYHFIFFLHPLHRADVGCTSSVHSSASNDAFRSAAVRFFRQPLPLMTLVFFSS